MNNKEYKIIISNITIDERKLIDMYLDGFDVDVIDDEDYTIIYQDGVDVALINQYIDRLSKIVEIHIERE